jgi:hypothetical protein
MSVYGAEFLKHIRDHLSILGKFIFISSFSIMIFDLDEDPVPVSFCHNGYFEENHKTQM